MADLDGAVDEPVPGLGWRVGAGQLEMIDDEGVTTAPLVLVGVAAPDGFHDYVFELERVQGLGPAIDQAVQTTIQVHGGEGFRRKQAQAARMRKHDRRLAIATAVMLAGFVAATGYGDSTEHGAADGVLTAVLTVLQGVGAWVMVLVLIHRIRNRRR